MSDPVATLARMDSDGDAAIAQYNADWERLRAAAHGEDVPKVERLVRDWACAHASWLEQVDVDCLARVMSDVRWVRKHPLSALALAWSHRRARPPHRTLLWLLKPRIAG